MKMVRSRDLQPPQVAQKSIISTEAKAEFNPTLLARVDVNAAKSTQSVSFSKLTPAKMTTISIDDLLKKSGIKKEEGNWLQKNFLGTEWGRTRGQIRAAAASVNKSDIYQYDFKKNPDFQYDPVENTITFANSAQGAQAYLRFLRKLEDFSTFSNGDSPLV
jgi:hypothetical protein